MKINQLVYSIMDPNDDVYDDIDDDVDEDNFEDDNVEFSMFKDEVKEWITLDDDITTLQKAIKERRDKKNRLTPKIIEYMDRFKINDLNTNDGKLKFTKSLYTKPINKEYLIAKLGDFFKDYKKAEKATGFIYENRDKQEKYSLKRVLDKKK